MNNLVLWYLKFSSETIFVTAEQAVTGSIIEVNCIGQVLSVTIDDANIVHYCTQQLNDPLLGLKIGSRKQTQTP